MHHQVTVPETAQLQRPAATRRTDGQLVVGKYGLSNLHSSQLHEPNASNCVPMESNESNCDMQGCKLYFFSYKVLNMHTIHTFITIAYLMISSAGTFGSSVSRVSGRNHSRFLRTCTPVEMHQTDVHSEKTVPTGNIPENGKRHLKRPRFIQATQQHLHGRNNNMNPNTNQRRRIRHGPPSTYISIGSCTEVCKHCKAFFLLILPTTEDCQGYIKELFQDRHFMENIRAYNQIFAMTSLGAELDESVNRGRGPYVFKVSGKIYHWIGSVCPEVNKEQKFLQLYIYDTANKVKNRLEHFKNTESRIRRDIVKNLIQILDNHNQFLRLFRTARDKMEGTDVPNFKVKLFGVVGSKQYDLLAGDSIGAIVFEGGPDVGTNYDVIIECHGGQPQRIDKLKPHYMSLHFPLLFIHGEEGYHLVLYTVEFQKRGLPHWHLLLWLKEGSRIHRNEDIDRYVCAELPNPTTNPEAHRVVSEFMLHGPCGLANTSARCMKDVDECKKGVGVVAQFGVRLAYNTFFWTVGDILCYFDKHVLTSD
ncbi:helitron helicase-like domain-containing protein [Artemisia annua]|uniref:Helitron helicase-like domain-containing protein n=1 Tax=Artemisia annua TaxID=35608 RepID=A0A2U1M4D4_ARTAN|nr:helitron helicase-like domain-containing protein [Artemisia annua]